MENTQKEQKALFFLELDLGTEKLIANNSKEYSLLKKMLTYKKYYDTNGFESYNEKFKHNFKGFRVLTVMNNIKRTQRIRKELTRHGLKTFIWFTQTSEITHETLFDKIWNLTNATIKEKHSILTN